MNIPPALVGPCPGTVDPATLPLPPPPSPLHPPIAVLTRSWLFLGQQQKCVQYTCSEVKTMKKSLLLWTERKYRVRSIKSKFYLIFDLLQVGQKTSTATTITMVTTTIKTTTTTTAISITTTATTRIRVILCYTIKFEKKIPKIFSHF